MLSLSSFPPPRCATWPMCWLAVRLPWLSWRHTQSVTQTQHGHRQDLAPEQQQWAEARRLVAVRRRAVPRKQAKLVSVLRDLFPFAFAQPSFPRQAGGFVYGLMEMFHPFGWQTQTAVLRPARNGRNVSYGPVFIFSPNATPIAKRNAFSPRPECAALLNACRGGNETRSAPPTSREGAMKFENCDFNFHDNVMQILCQCRFRRHCAARKKVWLKQWMEQLLRCVLTGDVLFRCRQDSRIHFASRNLREYRIPLMFFFVFS